jgi:uncharacterized protein YcbX
MTKLARITVYPIKSLDGADLTTAAVLPSGALLYDRRWAVVDDSGRVVNGKRTAAIHAIRATFANDFRFVNLLHTSIQTAQFELADESSGINEWLSEAVGANCRLVENRETGFPDDLDAPGPTLVSNGTVNEVSRWFELTPAEFARRFRANLTFDAGEPFWEDRLVGHVDQPVPFTIGEVSWLGVNPCQRCVVPSRDSLTGDATAGFQREFARRREAALSARAPRERFDHFYRLAVNTRLAPNCRGGKLSLGDELRIVASRCNSLEFS